MGPMQCGCISFFLLQMLPTLGGIKITDAPPTIAADTHADESAAINYRVSAPRPKESSNRVPIHQQDIRTGYVDDDADDVIHIIEPPQYFELLKMLVQQRMLPAEKAKHKLTVDVPKKIPIRDQTHLSSEVSSIKSPPKYLKKPLFRPPSGLPFELLASVRQRERLVHNAGRPVAMPLARERIKTQKLQTVFIEQGYAQKQFERSQQMQLGALRSGAGQVRRKQRVRRNAEKLVSDGKEVKKRHKGTSSKTASVLKSRKTKKTSKSRTAVKPGTKRYKARSPGTVARRRLEAKNKAAKLIKNRKENVATLIRRRKREAQQNKKSKEELYQKNVLLKGNELMDHLTALLKKATYYLPETPEAEKATESKAETTTKREVMKNMLAQKWQHETQPAELIGEMEPTQRTTETEVRPNGLLLLKEEQVNKIVANSWNVTHAIMDNLIKHKNSTSNEDEPQLDAYDNCSQSNESDEIEKLQQRIDCMRQQLLKEASNSTAMRLRKRFGERISEKKMSASLAVATKPTNRKIRKQRKQKYQQQQQQGASTFKFSSRIASPKQTQTIDNLSLLYEDVMTNIRNLLQAKNLEELEDELEQRTLSRKQQLAAEDASTSRFATPRQLIEDASDSEDFGEFNHLNKYLNELQQIVSDFVHPVRSNSDAGTTELSLNTREYAGSSTITQTSMQPDSANNWYLINDNGRIYQTHLAAELRPSIAVFHRFPDIPNAPFYLQNRTQLAEQSTGAIEIL